MVKILGIAMLAAALVPLAMWNAKLVGWKKTLLQYAGILAYTAWVATACVLVAGGMK